MLEFAGLKLKNPFVVASSPLTSKAHLIKRAEEYGAAAVSTKLTFIRQPFYGKLRMYNNPREGSIVCHDRRLDLEEGVRLIEDARRITHDLIIFSNITHAAEDLEGWARLAHAMEEAGAHAIEANMICPNLGLTARRLGMKGPTGGATPGQSPQIAREITRALKESVRIPVVCKLTPNVTDITEIALACQEGGADGICLAGAQLSLPPMDIYNPDAVYPLMDGAAMGSLGGPACRLQGYAAVASTARRVAIPIIGGGGLETWTHAVQFMMWGATLVTACTSLMWHGFDIIPRVIEGIEQFMAEQEYDGYRELIGRALHTLRPAEALEPIAGHPVVNVELCNRCGICTRPGHCDAITLTDQGLAIREQDCLGCGICVALCPRKALSWSAASSVSHCR